MTRAIAKRLPNGATQYTTNLSTRWIVRPEHECGLGVDLLYQGDCIARNVTRSQAMQIIENPLLLAII